MGNRVKQPWRVIKGSCTEEVIYQVKTQEQKVSLTINEMKNVLSSEGQEKGQNKSQSETRGIVNTPPHSATPFQGPFSVCLSSTFQDVASVYHLLRQKVVKPQGHRQCQFPWYCRSLWSLANYPFHLNLKISKQLRFLIYSIFKVQGVRKETN